VGDFRIEQSIDVETLSKESISQHLIPPLKAMAGLPSVRIDDAQRKRLSHGLAIPNSLAQKEGEVVAVNDQDHLVAVLTVTDQGLRPTRYFSAGEQGTRS
jgi:tRNA U55 pseudouridine synthase TruB